MNDRDNDPRLPKESLAQEIGQDALRAFNSRYPDDWRPDDLSGDSDVGLDFQVQVVRAGRYHDLFHVQLKGTRTPSIDAQHNYVGIDLKVSTLNYYANIPDPVMLVVADLSTNPDPRECSLYYKWLDGELRDIASDQSQKTRRVRVPLTNTLDRGLDVLPYLERERRKRRVGCGIFEELVKAGAEETFLEQAVAAGGDNRIRSAAPLMVDALSNESETPWLEAPKGSFARQLHDASENIQRGAIDAAESLLSLAESRLGMATNHERAEWNFLRAQLFDFQSLPGDALTHYRRANKHYPESDKYLAARIEHYFRAAQSDTHERYARRVYKLLPNTSSWRLASVKSKLLSILGEYDAALEVLRAHSVDNTCVAIAVVEFQTGAWSSVVDLTSQCLQSGNLMRAHEHIVRVIKARALLHLAFPSWSESGSEYLPLTGAADLDVDLLHVCWNEAAIAFDRLSQAGWPPITELLLDVLTVCAVMLGKIDEIYPRINALSSQRPGYVAAHEALERLAVVKGEPVVALNALRRQPSKPENLTRQAYICFDSAKYSEALRIAKEAIELLSEDDIAFRELLVVATVSAHVLLDPIEQLFRDRLDGLVGADAEREVCRLLISGRDDPAGVAASPDELLEALVSFPHSNFLKNVVLANLDASSPGGAAATIRVITEVRKERGLWASEARSLIQALTTSKRWGELGRLVEDLSPQFGDVPWLESARALALEGEGRSAEALAVLEKLVNASSAGLRASYHYLNVAVRCGYADKAAIQLRELIAQSESRKQKVELLRQLFTLEAALDPGSKNLYEIAWRYGELADREDEVEEGVFFQLYLMGTLNDAIVVPQARKAEFESRVKRYLEKFPNSEVFRAIHIPDDADGGALIQQLQIAVGHSPEYAKKLEALEERARRGLLVVPFSWRPKAVLGQVSDIVHLWELSKISGRGDRQFHLTMTTQGNTPNTIESIGDGPPLLDLITLLILKDLDLLDILFRVFGSIGITKRTLFNLQRLAHPLSGSVFRDRLVTLIDKLRANMHAVLQPGEILDMERTTRKDMFAADDEMSALISNGKWVLYSDDAWFRIYVYESADNDVGLCTLNLLHEADERGYLSPEEVAIKIAQLYEWRVDGLNVELRHFLAGIPKDLKLTTSVKDVARELDRSSTFKSLMEIAWGVGVDVKDAIRNMADLLAHALPQMSSDDYLIAGLWYNWSVKLSMRTEIQIGTINLIARVFALAVTRLNPTMDVTRRGWRIFWYVVEARAANRMSNQMELDACRHVGEVLADVASHEPVSESVERYRDALGAGLGAGTKPYDEFNAAYVARLVGQMNKKLDPGG